MEQCIICGTQLRENETVCPQCGFVTGLSFLSEKQYESWLREAVEPYRREYGQKCDSLLAEQQQKYQQEMEALQREYQDKMEELQRRQKEDIEKLEREQQQRLAEELQRQKEEILHDRDEKSSAAEIQEKPLNKSEEISAERKKKWWIPFAGVLAAVVVVGGITVAMNLDKATGDTTSIQGRDLLEETSSTKEEQSSTTEEMSGTVSWAVSKDGKTLTFSGTGSIDQDLVDTIHAMEMVETIVIENGISEIGFSAFYNCESLESITLPDSLKSIGDRAFFNCKNLKEIALPDSLQKIGNATFHNCERLERIVLPNSLLTIEYSAFGYCESLKSIILPDGLQHIGSGVFYNCTNLEKVMLPDSLQSIGNSSFSYCSRLETITFDGELPEIGDSAFYYVTATVYYPSSWKTVPASDACGGQLTWVPQDEIKA